MSYVIRGPHLTELIGLANEIVASGGATTQRQPRAPAGDGDLETLAVRYGDRSVPFDHLSRRLARTRSPMHDERGVLILKGEGARRGARLPDARLVDVGPTLLTAAGVPVPAGLDGRVPDVFEHEARPLAPAARGGAAHA